MKGRPLPRRDFLKQASAAGFGAIAMSRGFGPLFAFDGSPAEKMTVGVMGLNGRGTVLAHGFARNANATVAERDADMGRGAVFHDNRVEVERAPD